MQPDWVTRATTLEGVVASVQIGMTVFLHGAAATPTPLIPRSVTPSRRWQNPLKTGDSAKRYPQQTLALPPPHHRYRVAVSGAVQVVPHARGRHLLTVLRHSA
jgi:hypothetical protein